LHLHSVKDQISGDSKFAGAAALGDAVYFAPDGADAIGVFNVTTQTFRLHSIQQQISADGKFSGAAAHGDAVFFAPGFADSVGVFDVTTQTFHLKWQISGPGWKFSGATTLGDAVYFAPFDATAIGIVNVTTQTFRLHSIRTQITGGGKFSGAAALGDAVYFAPSSAGAIGIFDVAAQTFRLRPIETQISRDKFRGAAAFGGDVYFAPLKTDVVGIYGMVKASAQVLLGVEWSNEDRKNLKRLRDATTGRTSPCRMENRACAAYDCFDGREAHCERSRTCGKPTVNVRLVSRHSWFSALLRATTQTAYYEITATGIIVGLYLSHRRLFVSRDLPPGYFQVVLEGDSTAEVSRQRQGQ